MSEPSRKTTSLIDARDNQSCVRCGVSLEVVSGSRHHRKPRAIGGHGVANLILLCGSGVTGCHGWAHAHPVRAVAAGLIIPGNNRAQPSGVPVLVRWLGVEPHQSHVWVLLADDGTRVRVSEGHAQELLALYGLLPIGNQ